MVANGDSHNQGRSSPKVGMKQTMGNWGKQNDALYLFFPIYLESVMYFCDKAGITELRAGLLSGIYEIITGASKVSKTELPSRDHTP